MIKCYIFINLLIKSYCKHNLQEFRFPENEISKNKYFRNNEDF